jgi:5-methylcytosine-specific restriction endonuclease McrA
MPEYAKRRKLALAERKAVYDKTGGHCAYCGAEITMKQMQADHVIPMEFYDAYKAIGKDIDDIGNMLPACRSCNNYKSSLTLEKFREAIGRWPTVLERDSVTYRNAVRYGLVKPEPHPIVFYFEKLKEDSGQ